MRFWTAYKKTGDKIQYFDSYEEAKKAINFYEIIDKIYDCYTEDFYNIVNDDCCTIDENGNEIR